MMKPVLRSSLLLAISLFSAAALAPSAAMACGGLFCNTGVSQPVDQTAEQIIFAHEGDHGVAHIQISYTGSLPDFGWIVPVRTVPDVSEGSMVPFNELNSATAPRFVAPRSSGTGSTGGCAPLCAVYEARSLAAGSAADSANEVTVIKEGSFGAFNYVILDSTSADAMYQWLDVNHYNAPENAKAIVQKYLDEQSKFIALKLQPDSTVKDITPIKLTFPAWDPCIPLRLTAIAAQPDMGVLVYIFGDTRAEPTAYGSVTIDDSLIKFTSTNGAPTNYKTVVTTAVKNAGSHAFVTEYAGATATMTNSAPVTFSPETLTLIDSSPYITRLYTVMSPADMTIDPTFSLSAAGKLGNVSNIHQLPASSRNSSMAPVETLFLVSVVGAFLRRRKPAARI
jgi:hypothetical protein